MLDLLTLFIFPFFGTIKSESYPPALSSEDEKKYIDMMEAGDKNARNKLIEHNLRLVAHIAKKYENTFEDKDDILSIGMIGLIKAVDSFNFNATNKLGTYAAKCIENEILMHLRSNKNKRNYTWLSTPIGLDKDGNEIELMDIVKDESIPVDEQMEIDETHKKLYESIKLLNPRELDIISRRYGLFNKKIETQKDIAKQMKISRSYVSRIEKRALMKLYLAISADK
jgi:RNA polymerase sporulation-specific sigma factor